MTCLTGKEQAYIPGQYPQIVIPTIFFQQSIRQALALPTKHFEKGPIAQSVRAHA